MDSFTRADMDKLIEKHEELCLSIYLPTFTIEDKTKQNPVLLRDIIEHATKELISAGMEPTDAKLLTEEIEELTYDTEFWLYSCDSLCLFAADKEFFVYRLPLKTSQNIQVSHYYNVLPLFEMLLNKDYYLLTVDEDGVRFYEGNRFGLADLTSNDLRKKTISDVRSIVGKEESSGSHMGRVGGARSKEELVFHGRESAKDDRKVRMKEFLQSIISVLPKVLSEDSTPVILAGNEEVVSYFRSIYPYHNLLEEQLVGDVQLKKTEQLFLESWELVEKILDEEKQAAKDKYCNLKSTKLISNQLEEIVPAAFHGQVDTLFVDTEKSDFGKFDEMADKLLVHLPKKPDDEELGNLAAIKTFVKEGKVYLFNTETMPDKTELNAVYRYDITERKG